MNPCCPELLLKLRRAFKMDAEKGSIEIVVFFLLALIVMTLAFPLVGFEEKSRNASENETSLLAQAHFF